VTNEGSERRRLREVLDATREAYFCVDASGRVVHYNRAAEQLLGIDRSALQQVDLIGVFVTERVRMQEEFAEQARRLDHAQSLAGLGSWEQELATGAVRWSPQLYRILAMDEDAPVTAATLLDRVHPEDLAETAAAMAGALEDGDSLHLDTRMVRADGQCRWVALHADVVTGADGTAVRVSGIVHDITDRKLAELELERLTVTDALTGLANRKLLDERLETALLESEVVGPSVALLLLDLDRFKPVNDIHGHAAGDAVLVEIADRLARCVRPGDTLARQGGDEFCVVLPGADRADAMQVAQRLVDAASAPVRIPDGTEVIIGASVGVAVSTPPSKGIGELRREADRALYTAKRSGRGRFAVFTADLELAGTDHLRVHAAHARAWADYMGTLRDEIARRKDEGRLATSTKAPTSVLRTLETLISAIAHLPPHEDDAKLPLPERLQLEEFVFHQSMVHTWADTLADDGVLTTRRPPAADAFWFQLHLAATTDGPVTTHGQLDDRSLR